MRVVLKSLLSRGRVLGQAGRGLDVTLVKTSRAGHEAHFAFLRDNGGAVTVTAG